MINNVLNGYYIHDIYDGKIYKLLHIAKNAETFEDLAVYLDISNNEIFTTSLNIWNEKFKYTGISGPSYD